MFRWIWNVTGVGSTLGALILNIKLWIQTMQSVNLIFAGVVSVLSGIYLILKVIDKRNDIISKKNTNKNKEEKQ